VSSGYTNFMITQADRDYLIERRDILAEVEAVRVEMAEMVRKLLDAGESPTELATLTGLTRARIYQIRDHRR